MTDYTSWHVGMKVVCVVDPDKLGRNMKRFRGAHFPQVGGIYTVREIRALSDRVILLLAEISNQHIAGQKHSDGSYSHDEPGFNIKYFRPVQKRKTDISIFTAMLHDKKEHAPA